MAKGLDLGIQQMKDQALKNGVAVIALNKYLEMIGYRLPRETRAERSSLYTPSFRPESRPPAGKLPPPAAAPDK